MYVCIYIYVYMIIYVYPNDDPFTKWLSNSRAHLNRTRIE